MNKYALVRSAFTPEIDVPGDLVMYVASPMSGSELEVWLTQEQLYPHPYVRIYDLPSEFPVEFGGEGTFELPVEVERLKARTAEILDPDNHGPITARSRVIWFESDTHCLGSGMVLRVEPAQSAEVPAQCLVRLSNGRERTIPEDELRLAVAHSPSTIRPAGVRLQADESRSFGM